MGKITLKSSAFKEGEHIPAKHACGGDNTNPLLEIKNIPENAKSLVLIMEDPDASSGVWDHWILWNISPTNQYINEDSIPENAVLGTNSFGKAEYNGPCPPMGDNPHRYFFKVFALDANIDLPFGSSKKDLLEAIKDHLIDQASLMGLYQRK